MADFGQSFVNVNRIGAIGLCRSGSFVIIAGNIDSRKKAIATAGMHDMGTASRDALNRPQAVGQRKQIIAAAPAQRDVEFAGAAAKYTGGIAHALAANTRPIQREFCALYRPAGGEVTPKDWSKLTTIHPTLSTNVKLMNLYPFDVVETTSPSPPLFTNGDQAHSPEFKLTAFFGRHLALPIA